MYFRRRFRVPYELFLSLMTCILEERWFSGYENDGRGKLDATRDERRRGASLQRTRIRILSSKSIPPWAFCLTDGVEQD